MPSFRWRICPFPPLFLECYWRRQNQSPYLLKSSMFSNQSSNFKYERLALADDISQCSSNGIQERRLKVPLLRKISLVSLIIVTSSLLSIVIWEFKIRGGIGSFQSGFVTEISKKFYVSEL
jgi:hypothetical protein